MLKLIPGVRYDMPVSFGPSQVPSLTQIDVATVLSLSFQTEKTALEGFLPLCFSLPENPIVTVAHVSYCGVDYLGGRGYNEVVISVSAAVREGGTRIDANAALVLWVNQTGALIAGREFMGLPKLHANITDLQQTEIGWNYEIAEYEQPLIKVKSGGWRPLDLNALEKINQRAKCVQTFGWKFIASPELGTDVNYPLMNVMRWDYQHAWSGEAELQFFPQNRQTAPLSHEVINQLARLPIIGKVRAFMGSGKATIDRTATRRILPDPVEYR